MGSWHLYVSIYVPLPREVYVCAGNEFIVISVLKIIFTNHYIIISSGGGTFEYEFKRTGFLFVFQFQMTYTPSLF